MELTAENVRKTLMKCLFENGEDTTNHVKVEGVRIKIGFNPVKVEEQKANIESMLNQMPDGFKKSIGGGQSFLNACMDNSGNQWGEHENIDELIALGMAIGKISFLLPKELWSSLPGGMPYFVIKDEVLA